MPLFSLFQVEFFSVFIKFEVTWSFEVCVRILNIKINRTKYEKITKWFAIYIERRLTASKCNPVEYNTNI